MNPLARTGCAIALLAGLAACERTPTTQPAAPVPRLDSDGQAAPPAAPLRAKFAARRARDPLLQDSEIRFTVLPGRVRLSGIVTSAAAKLRAAELARDLAGAAELENRLVVRREPGLARTPIDSARVYL